MNLGNCNMSDVVATSDESGMELLNVNWQTTAALGLTVATGGVTGALMLTAFPAQTLAAAGGIGVLAYAGKNRADGNPAFPFMKKDEVKTDAKSDKSTSKAEAAPAAA